MMYHISARDRGDVTKIALDTVEATLDASLGLGRRDVTTETRCTVIEGPEKIRVVTLRIEVEWR